MWPLRPERISADAGALLHAGQIAAPYSNADVRPTNSAPIIRIHEGQRLALPARWGLIPSWSKDDKIAQHTFNAGGETVADKPSFRAAFKRRRCIVPVSAFFEWRVIPGEKKKQKLRFSSPGQHPLALAGLWEHWQRPETGEPVETYTIITTAANDFMAPIHDRMPVILGQADWDLWLSPETGSPLLLQSMLAPARMTGWNVRRPDGRRIVTPDRRRSPVATQHVSARSCCQRSNGGCASGTVTRHGRSWAATRHWKCFA